MRKDVFTLAVATVIAVVGGAGCARVAESAMPSAAVRSDGGVAPGKWSGTVGGRETGDANGPQLGNARLTISPDGAFTLTQTFSVTQGVSTLTADGTARMSRGRIVLDGRIASPDSRKGEPFGATLWPRGNGLYGETDVVYRGVRTPTEIELGAVPS